MGFLSDFNVASTVWTVTELTDYIHELFEIDFRLRDVEVAGEISNFVRARSGHLYFTLKDHSAQIKCVMWRTAAERMEFNPQDGDAVVAQGRISVYPSGGVYQLYAERITPAGRGDLALAFEQLKAKLNAAGYFDPEHKQPIPLFPRKIGIVTSADAAALRDILNVLERRCPLVSVLIAPTLVQGEQAPAQIVRALRWLDGRNDIDTIIIARGGGSMEDLWAFNNEQVVGAIFEAKHPVISGVGHEVDFTLTDFVADLRAPTPSAAAELAVPDLSEYQSALAGMQARLTTLIHTVMRQKKWQLQSQKQALSLLSPRAGLDNNSQRLDGFSMRLEQVMQRHLARAETELAVLHARLAAISPLATLLRGYAIVRGENGRIIGSVGDVAAGANIFIQVSDGRFGATVTRIESDA